MNMAELMPHHLPEPCRFGRRLQHIAQQFGLAWRVTFAVPEHEISGAVRVMRCRCVLSAVVAFGPSGIVRRAFCVLGG